MKIQHEHLSYDHEVTDMYVYDSKLCHLESFVLQNLLDSNESLGVAEPRLVDDSERTVADDLRVGVRDLLGAVGATLTRRGDDGRHLTAVFACDTSTVH